MNFDQAKALRLQRWRSTLDDHDFRMENPEVHRQTLREMSVALASEGLVDELQCFDMNELADAAYWHAVEDLIDAPARYCSASLYDVVTVGSSEAFGAISRSIFYYKSSLRNADRSTYDGKIYQDACGANLVFSPSGVVARITGLTLAMSDGQQFELVETGRTIDGITYEPTDDSDAYRALIEMAVVAKESRDLRLYEKLRPLIDLAKFHQCSSCLDHFAQREDCAACGGEGFVPSQH
jgi:hypothetical protein